MARKRAAEIPDHERVAIVSAMCELGISQNAAAAALGVSQPSLRAWLVGDTAFTRENAQRLLGVISARLACTLTTGEAVATRLQAALAWGTAPQPPATPAAKRRAKAKVVK